ncbi:shikimate 5-dehydrogenase [Arthrobacter sp. MYb224]|uniref:shikimate 5-dehydrogenase n=1 Tax=unclassified Arthrobacter TaxID=235627 RepID=UPI000CFE1464|nr:MULTISPECIES: shikimate 5-dehydrogenase [unclassified Arthrobacter]PQZ99663.1 shikimate 5-dehydrogenase [Arthrobacter sp. MYb224]PRA05870.1 shikimate 5-dehydrogenase [Arthrobacter sp. MYb229]PRB52771.1 shikimate 5-dehydrogenase [Arthrobacter sp. MYb216]
MPILNKDMTLCISLSERPSNLGTRFHNYLYEELGLNFIYKAFATQDLDGAIAGVRALGIRGCAVSMPFKEDVMELVDVIEPSAASIESVNTIVNDQGVLRASNTDYEAIAKLITHHGLNPNASVLVRGSGGMAKAVIAAFRDAGFENLTVLARNAASGKELATKYGYRHQVGDPEPGHDILVNVTPLGMDGPHQQELAFELPQLAAAETVFDVVAFPAQTPLIRAAEQLGKQVITGAEVIALQAAAQFEKYTGIRLSEDQVRRASEFSRS